MAAAAPWCNTKYVMIIINEMRATLRQHRSSSMLSNVAEKNIYLEDDLIQ